MNEECMGFWEKNEEEEEEEEERQRKTIVENLLKQR